MILQLAIGTAVVMISTLISGVGYMLLEMVLVRSQPWALRPPHNIKLLALLCGSMLWTLLIVTAGVWIWAVALRLLGIFITMEGAVYFAAVSFTTLGFGDILLPVDWRLLGGMAAANGLLSMGLMTAMLIEVLRHVRLGQMEMRRKGAET